MDKSFTVYAGACSVCNAAMPSAPPPTFPHSVITYESVAEKWPLHFKIASYSNVSHDQGYSWPTSFVNDIIILMSDNTLVKCRDWLQYTTPLIQ